MVHKKNPFILLVQIIFRTVSGLPLPLTISLLSFPTVAGPAGFYAFNPLLSTLNPSTKYIVLLGLL